MPIEISRKTEEIISAPEYTQNQKNKAWEMIVEEWAKKNPEKLRKAITTEEQEKGPE